MSTQYTVHVKGKPHPEKPRRRAAFLLRQRSLVSKAKGPFTIERDNNGEEGPVRTEGEVNKIVRNWSKKGEIGSRLDVHAQDTVLAFKCIQVAPPVPAPDIAPELVPVYVRVFTNYGWVTNLGNWFCRYIAGTHTVSRHGYYGTSWRGAAQDFGCPDSAHLELLANNIVHWTTDHTDPLYGKVDTVIVHNRIWSKTGGWNTYNGVYHYHVHIDVQSGSPCHP
jgi:hypothetical protein